LCAVDTSKEYNGHYSVTAEAAGSSPVSRAISFKHPVELFCGSGSFVVDR
jgi:hypothetical protein